MRKLTLCLAAISAGWLLATAAAVAQEGGLEPRYYDHPHMWGNWGWGGMIFGPIMGIVYVGLIVAAIVLVVRWLGGGQGIALSSRGRTALQILEERFAKGEIDRDEFEERRRILSE